MASEGARDADRAARIECMVAALRDVFGDKAGAVAERQIDEGGKAGGTWRAIAARLSGDGTSGA